MAAVVQLGHTLQLPACAEMPFSQGGWETDEDVEAAAARETVEEAGVRGRLQVRVSNSLRQPAAVPHKQYMSGCLSWQCLW
jgi:hypothetical protein